MSKSSLLTDLPSELIEHILLDEVIAVEDLCRASQTCKKLHSVAQSNELWKQKLKSRWPELVAKYPTSASPWWQDVYKYRHSCQQRVHSMVEGLSPLHFNDDEISKDGFSEFRALLEESEHSGMTIIDALMDIFRHGSSHENLTMKYYAEKVLRHLQQLRLSREFTEFLDQPPEKQLIELGAVIVAQWCQPTVDITASGICRQLDDIAVRVLKHLQLNQPNHPACCAELYFDRPLSSSLWKPVQCRQVLEAVKHVLYTDMGFRGNYHNYYAPTNSYINMVLELRLGIPISLSIVFSAIARRLGVLCLPVNFPSHFLLKWKEHPTLEGPLQDSYIDVFKSARFLSQNELASALEIPRSALRDETVYDAIPPRLVYERMARNLVHIGRQQGQMGDSLLGMRNALQLYLVISPDDIEKRLLLARLNLHLNINLADVVESLQRVSELDPSQAELAAYMVSAAQAHLQHEKTAHRSKEIKQKKRPDPATNEVAFSIGMIMKHKRYHYVCVIYGWDVRCMASPEWIIQMGVNNLPKKDTQPFYNVLVQDGSNRYAAQENLEFAPNPSEVTHPEVGKYFQEFCKTYYMPNAEKMTQYPEDLALTRSETANFYQTET